MSKKRADVYEFIKEAVAKKKEFPSFQAISDACDISRSTAHYHVGVLKRKKVLIKDPVRGYMINPDYQKNEVTG